MNNIEQKILQYLSLYGVHSPNKGWCTVYAMYCVLGIGTELIMNTLEYLVEQDIAEVKRDNVLGCISYRLKGKYDEQVR